MRKILLSTLLILTACGSGEYDKANIITGSAEAPKVIPPECPDWTSDSDEANSSNFGCASRNNMGQMVLDPMDMVTGRGTNYYDGQRTAAAVSVYRNPNGGAAATTTTTTTTDTTSGQ